MIVLASQEARTLELGEDEMMTTMNNRTAVVKQIVRFEQGWLKKSRKIKQFYGGPLEFRKLVVRDNDGHTWEFNEVSTDPSNHGGSLRTPEGHVLFTMSVRTDYALEIVENRESGYTRIVVMIPEKTPGVEANPERDPGLFLYGIPLADS